MYRDQRESSYQPFEIVNIHSNSEQSDMLCKLFVNEFFYYELVYNNPVRKQGITINEGANDLIYELSDFSKKHPDEEFVLEFMNRRNKKTQKIFKIQAGNATQTFSYDKNKPKNTKKPSNPKNISVRPKNKEDGVAKNETI